MGVWELLLVGLVVLLGLCGVLVPGVPGSWLVWAAILWWALEDPQPVAWVVLVGATAALFVSQVVRWSLPPRRLRASGATPRMAVYAGLGAFLGFFLIPVLGAIPGSWAASISQNAFAWAATAKRGPPCAERCARAAPASSRNCSPAC